MSETAEAARRVQQGFPELTGMLIGARRPTGGSGTADGPQETIDVLDPATERLLTRVPQAGPELVDRAVSAAAAAHADGRWRSLAPTARRDLLDRLADLVELHAEELALIDCLDNGKAVERARGDVALGLAALRHFSGAPTRLTGTVLPSAPGRHVFTTREPVGVVALVLPWNFPFMIAAWKLAPALAAGCTAVVKPAEQTPLSALRLAELCLEAGIPEGVVNVVTGDGRTGAALVAHPGVAKISFTGSTDVGRAVMAAAAANITGVTLELGGKSPNIVCADADLDRVMAVLPRTAFGHSGQMCTAGSRLLVHRSLLGELTERLVPAVQGLTVGPGLSGGVNVGPLVSAEQRDRVAGYLDIAVAEGATTLVGGKVLPGPGYYVEPTVFTDLTPDMRIAREEVFGPVLGVMGFDTDEEAVALANDSDYGLAAGVWTGSLARAHHLSALLQAGTVWVNTYNDFDAALPFGGVKRSGLGRDLGDASVEGFTELKSVVMEL